MHSTKPHTPTPKLARLRTPVTASAPRLNVASVADAAIWPARPSRHLTMKYGNADALTTDKQTARNDFFTEKAAMITDEGSWNLANIRNINPDLEDHVVQSYVPLTNDADRNKISVDLISMSVSKTTEHPEEAKELLKWLATSEAATSWYMDMMGSLPVSTNADASAERVGCLSAQLSELMAEGKSAASLQSLSLIHI